MVVAALHNINENKKLPPMVSRWRRRRMCVLIADRPSPAALRDISGNGAFVETSARPPLGAAVSFHHPEAGAITARVTGYHADGIRIAFSGDSEAVAFALTAITTDMTRS